MLEEVKDFILRFGNKLQSPLITEVRDKLKAKFGEHSSV